MNLSFLVGMLLFGAAVVHAEPLRIAVEGAYPPFNYINLKGELEGFDVDVAKAVCAHQKRECTFVAIPWEGMIPGLLGKKFDVIASSMSISAERKKQVLFTQSYYHQGAVLVASAKRKLGVGDNQLTVGVQRGATYESFAKKLNPSWTLKIYDKAKDHNQDLKLGRIDAALGQQVVMDAFVKENPSFAVKAGPLFDDDTLGVGAGIAFRKQDNKLAAEFDTALNELRKSGQLKSLAMKYFDFDISASR